MKKLSNLKKAELIELITEIRPKADAYDRVCKSVGVGNNLLGFIKNLDIQRVSNRLIDKVTVTNLDLAFRMVGISCDKETVDKIIDLVELIESKGDDTSMKDVIELKGDW